MQRLTKRIVESAEIKKKHYLIFDNLIKGFCIKISPSGRRNYYFQYFKTKAPKRFLLGQHGVITTEQARDMAVSMLAKINAGNDPCAEKTTKKLEPLISDVAERFMREHALARCKPNTKEGYRFLLNKHILPSLKNAKISEITKMDIAKLQHTISVEHSQDAANRSMRVLSKLFNLAEVWGLRAESTNPCKHIKKFPMKSRNRYLNQEEAKKLGKALDDIKQCPDENLAAVYCIQLLMLTGCRLGEIQTLKWEYVDYENELLRLPDSKTGAKIVYVGDAVMSLLDEIKQHPTRPQDNPYVIWGKKHGTYLNNIQKPWRRFRKLAELDDLHIHDLRHSFASFAVNRGMSLAMIGKLLGHTQVQTTSRYAHLMAKPMKEAANSITSELSTLLKVDAKRRNDLKEAQTSNASIIKGTNIAAPKYLTSEQAAGYLGVKQSLMENWRWKKTGPVFSKVGKAGSRIRYTLEDLEKFLEASKANADRSKQHNLSETLAS